MTKKIIKMGQEPKARDNVAANMWGRVKSATFRDRRKTLARKAKHKGLAF